MGSILTFAVGLQPPSRAKNWLLRRLGNNVDKSAVVRPILMLPGARLDVAAKAHIGALTVIRNAEVVLGEGAELGQLNWISAASFLVDASTCPERGRLLIGSHASVTNRHYFDVSGGVVVGPFATVAGVRSTFMTHGINVLLNGLTTEAIVIGSYAMVGSNCSFVLGATVPGRSVVGMGAVVAKGLIEEGGLYVGSPARLKKLVDLGAYGARAVGKVPVLREPGDASARDGSK